MSAATQLNVVKIRGLAEMVTREGIFIMCAIDHRASLAKMLDPKSPETISVQRTVGLEVLRVETLALIRARCSSS